MIGTLMDSQVALTMIGALIRDHREARWMTQQDLAAPSGCSRSSVANIEAGRQDIPVTRLLAFASVLRISPVDLLPGGDTNTAAMAAENQHLKATLAAARAALDTPL